jgi:hypothetical protein
LVKIRVLQEYGLGRSALETVEQVAHAPPLHASLAVLDTIQEDFQLRGDFLKTMLDNCGQEQPKVLHSNEARFKRQGYEVYRRDDTGYMWHNVKNEVLVPVPLVFLRKYLCK